MLSASAYRARLRTLRAGRHQIALAHIGAFLERAKEELRQAPHDARQLARLALWSARHIEDRAATRKCLRVLVQASTLGGCFSEGLRAVEEAIALARIEGDDAEAAELEVMRVQLLVNLEEYTEARESGRSVLCVFEAQGNTRGIIRARMALADLAYRIERPREALRHYAAVVAAMPEDAANRLRATVAVNRANALQACNRFRAAVRWFRYARELFALEGCTHTVAQLDYNLAYSEYLRGQFDDALRMYARVEAQFKELKDERHLGHCDLDRAEIHLELHLPADAEVFAERAIRRFAQVGMQKEQAQARYYLGRAAEMQARHAEAAEHYHQAQQQFDDLGLKQPRISCLVQLAYVHAHFGQLEESRRLADVATELYGDETNPLTAASVDLLRANLDLLDNKPSSAFYTADQVLMRCRRIHAPWIHIEAWRIVGRAASERGQSDQAILAYKAAIELLERYRGGVPPDEYMTAFLGGRSQLYADIINLLVQRGDMDLAFEFTERAKARALFDLIAGRDPSEPTQTPTPRRVRYLRQALNAVYRNLFRATTGPAVPAGRSTPPYHSQAAELEEEIVRLARMQRHEPWEDAAFETMRVLDLKTVQGHLEPGTTLLEYFLSDDRLFTFAVTNDSIHVVRQELGERELEERLQRFRFHLAKHERPKVVAPELVLRATRDNLKKLAGRLLEPIAEQIQGRRLVVVPHGKLHQLPFHALPWKNGWLTDAFEVVYAPSAAVFSHCATRVPSATGPACVFSLPDGIAPNIEREAQRVSLLLDTRDIYEGERATLDNLRRAASSARILHIASHGVFNRANPQLSAVRLGDGWISRYDLLSVRVRSELVVLATCESGTAGVADGNELMGLSRGFLCAGARALLCSQWRVHDSVTTEFMTSFYRHLRTAEDAVAAHRAAMVDLRERHPHPYHWAPFFFMGCPAESTTGFHREDAGSDKEAGLDSGSGHPSARRR
ncbi:MAG: CHAT domain-containing protein [Planctomycetota bacterium]|nr:CHAT domain-containing protein [Planctomycetota bacterium]